MITIPVKYIPHGNREECDRLRGQAQRVMLILENIMHLNGWDQYSISFTPYDGSLIVAHKFFGNRTVDIYAGRSIPQEAIPTEKICICNCNFSVGWIFEIQVGETINSAQLYTVMACNNDGRSYIRYENVLASDWTEYEIGDRIVMVPYNSMAFLCCTDPTGGDDRVRGCRPKVSTETTDSDDWRTTYRIIPMCSLMIPKEVDSWRFNTRG